MTPGQDQVLALVRAEPWLKSPEIAETLGVPGKTVSRALAALRQQGLVVSVRSKDSAVWTTPEAAAGLRATFAAQGKLRKTAIERASRQRAIADDDTDNLPQKVIWSSTWVPIKAPPGPVDVFHWRG